MANEQLTIGQDKARLSVIGKSWPDMNFDSGIGLDLSQIIFDILIDLDIPMPDIDFDDLDDITIIPGLDIDTEIPVLEYPDPDWPDVEIPPIIDWPMPDLDWDDFIDKLEDLGIDPNILIDLSFVGLNDLELPTLVTLDMYFNIQKDELPASIEIVTPPKKLEYQDGERIDLTGMVVTAKKADGSTWTSAKYPNGHIPLQELIIEPTYADVSQTEGGIWTGGGINAILSAADGEWLGREDAPSGYRCSATPNVGLSTKGATVFLTQYNGYAYSAKCTANTIGFMPATSGHSSAGSWPSANKTDLFRYEGVVYTVGMPESTIDPSGKSVDNLTPIKATQEIYVNWSRFGDGELLSAVFEIEVKESPGGGGR